MNRRIISVLIVFLLLASVTIPTVTAVETPEVYYELHDMCLCGAHADLGRIPFATFGIGYETHNIAPQSDSWEIFIHAGSATKPVTITPATPTGKMVLLRDFVNAVDECTEESDQVPDNLKWSLLSGSGGAGAVVYGGLSDNALITGGGLISVGASIEEMHQAVTHFNNAKNSQKKAEKLFGEL